jgi:DNA-binding NarL/FixJ family response regulator
VDASAPPIRILVVDDHDVVREGLAAMLHHRPGYEIVAMVGTAAEALTAADRFVPDIVILDVHLPDGSGIETCREIKSRHPEVGVIILTGSGDEDLVLTAVIAGANGYLLKQSGARDLWRTVDVVASGGSMVDPVATDRMVQRIRRASQTTESDPFASLTPRERQILDLVATGLTNREIAEQVLVSEKTVKRSVSAILSKLDLQRRGQAAALYTRRQPPD